MQTRQRTDKDNMVMWFCLGIVAATLLIKRKEVIRFVKKSVPSEFRFFIPSKPSVPKKIQTQVTVNSAKLKKKNYKY